MKVLLIDPFGDALDLALRAQDAGHEVRHYVNPAEKKYALVGKGLVKRITDFRPSLIWADLTVLCDNVKHLREIDRFRVEHPDRAVFGPNSEGASWETDRLLGMKVLEEHGIPCPPTRSFSSFDAALAYVKKRDTRLVCKPCGDGDKALSYCSKGPEDMTYMLRKWEKLGCIKGEFILQDFIPGREFAVGAYVGRDGFGGGWEENFEHKKLMPGEIGTTTGEMGTALMIVDKSKLANKVLKPLEKALRQIKYLGDIDVNCIVDENGHAWPLEFTMRMGYPALQIQSRLFPKDPVQWMYEMATGKGEPNFLKDLVSLGISVCISPFPYDSAPIEKSQGFPVFGVTPHNRKKLHPYHIQKGDETEWMTAGTYGMVVTGVSDTVSGAAENAYRTLKQVHIPGDTLHRNDIGKKLADFLPDLQKHGYAAGWKY